MKQTAVIFLYIINSLVFITQMECVLCAVGIELLCMVWVGVCVYIYIYIYIYNLNQGCTNLRCQVALITKFCIVAPNVYESILSMELALYHLSGI
jgi:hypothetical protein